MLKKEVNNYFAKKRFPVIQGPTLGIQSVYDDYGYRQRIGYYRFFNITNAAEINNAENLLIIKSKESAKDYIDNWGRHRKHSHAYGGRE